MVPERALNELPYFVEVVGGVVRLKLRETERTYDLDEVEIEIIDLVAQILYRRRSPDVGLDVAEVFRRASGPTAAPAAPSAVFRTVDLLCTLVQVLDRVLRHPDDADEVRMHGALVERATAGMWRCAPDSHAWRRFDVLQRVETAAKRVDRIPAVVDHLLAIMQGEFPKAKFTRDDIVDVIQAHRRGRGSPKTADKGKWNVLAAFLVRAGLGPIGPDDVKKMSQRIGPKLLGDRATDKCK